MKQEDIPETEDTEVKNFGKFNGEPASLNLSALREAFKFCKELSDELEESSRLVREGHMNCRLIIASGEIELKIFRALENIFDESSVAPANPHRQLFALSQAVNCWKKLLDVEKEGITLLTRGEIREKLIFIIAAIGLSLSQFLEQFPLCQAERAKSPHKLFDIITDGSEPQKEIFDEFMEIYAASLNFYKTPSQSNILDKLTEDKCKMFLSITIKLWEIVLKIHKERLAFDEKLAELKKMNNRLEGWDID